jgi:hypothetical protein
MRKKTGASTILKEIEENRDFELFSSFGHFLQSFWCWNDLNGKMAKVFLWLSISLCSNGKTACTREFMVDNVRAFL